jgi:hypothetical protein
MGMEQVATTRGNGGRPQPFALAVGCAVIGMLVGGCGAAAVSHPPGEKTVNCDSVDYSTPDWQNPGGGTRVATIGEARRVSGMEVIPPVGLGKPAAIFAQKGVATWFVFHGPQTGDLILVEAKPQLAAGQWNDYLAASVSANGKPGTIGTASIAVLAPSVKALQTVSPCLTGSTTDWRTADGRLEITIEARTMQAANALRIARWMSRSQ